jgi:hypothetical protein
MLALTQLNSLDVCQQLPSIINLLASHCESSSNQISESNLGYLGNLYTMSADDNLRMQQDRNRLPNKADLGREVGATRQRRSARVRKSTANIPSEPGLIQQQEARNDQPEQGAVTKPDVHGIAPQPSPRAGINIID